MKPLLLSSFSLLDHGSSRSDHPEHPQRLKAILTAIEESPYRQLLDLSVGRLATKAELCLVHEAAYVDYVLSLQGQDANLDYETILSPGSVHAALLAAGLGLELVDQILAGNVQEGFALLRPPGHHARPGAAMGFCIFNNIALAAKMALAKGLKRILIIDWDVHHGNGTQEIFYADERVLFIDFHQQNLFPTASGLLSEIGAGRGRGFTVNIPFPDSCRDADYLYAFEKLVRPLALRYQPELILVSAGFDAHETDPLGSMQLTMQGFGMLTSKVKSLADELCGGKVAFFLEGGYDAFYLARNVMSCIAALANPKASQVDFDGDIQPYSHGVETLVKEIHEVHFK